MMNPLLPFFAITLFALLFLLVLALWLRKWYMPRNTHVTIKYRAGLILLIFSGIILVIAVNLLTKQLTAMPTEKTSSLPTVNPEYYYPDRVSIFFPPEDIELDAQGNEFLLVRGDPNIVKRLNDPSQLWSNTYRGLRGQPRGFFTIFVPEGTDLDTLSQTLKNLTIVESAGKVQLPVFPN
jgi:hypothetical protein